MLTVLLGINRGVELLGHLVTLFGLLKNHETVFLKYQTTPIPTRCV